MNGWLRKTLDDAKIAYSQWPKWANPNSIMSLPEVPETHQQGLLSVENLELIQAEVDKLNCDVGIQISTDGRIWICVNGMAFIRFKPKR